MKHASVLFALAIGFIAAVQAANAPTPPADLVVCSRMPDREERLNCYDTRMAAMLAASSPAPAAAPPAVAASKSEPAQVAAEPARVASVPAPPSAVLAPTPEQKFGSEDLSPAARAKVEKPDKVLLSTITSIREVRPKLWIIVLGNGQIWMQEGTQITMFFRAGYDVRIEKGLLGDYRMSSTRTGEKNMVKITRIQ
jgi:hypothetical protein